MQLADARRQHFTELAAVGHQNALARSQHGVMFHRQLVEVVAGCALVLVDACRRDKCQCRAEIVENGMRANWRKERVVGMELAAAQDHVAGRFFFQRQKSIHGTADGCEGKIVRQRVNDIGNSRAAVEKHRVVLTYQAGGTLLPNDCARLFSVWQSSGQMSPITVLERIRLAMKAGNDSLVSFLAKTLRRIT